MAYRATAFLLLFAAGLAASACDTASPTSAVMPSLDQAPGAPTDYPPGPPQGRVALVQLGVVHLQLTVIGRELNRALYPPGPPTEPPGPPSLAGLKAVAIRLGNVGERLGNVQMPPGPPDDPLANQLQGIVTTALNIAGTAAKYPPGPPNLKDALADISTAANAIAASALKLLSQQ
jgi:hypothetical protein